MAQRAARQGPAHAPAHVPRPPRRTSYPNLEKAVNTSSLDDWPSDGYVVSADVPATEWPDWTDRVAFTDFPDMRSRERKGGR